MQQPRTINDDENNLLDRNTHQFDDENLYKPYEKGGGATVYKACRSFCGAIVQCTLCCCAPCEVGPIQTINQGHVGLKTEFGKYTGKLPPGLYSFNPCTENIISVDMRAKIIDVGLQTLLTKDSVTVMIDAYVNYSVVEPEKAVFKVQNYQSMMTFLTRSVMKTIVAEHTLGEMLINRKVIEKKLTNIIDEKTHSYGLKVMTIETQRIQLPQNMERAMATVAESQKRSEARVIDARGNLESAKVFKQAADTLSQNEVSLQLQYFETLKTVASEQQSTIVLSDSILGEIRANKERKNKR